MAHSESVICVMDDLAQIKPAKDTSFALMLEAQRRGLPVWYANEGDLQADRHGVYARLQRVRLHDRAHDWFEVESHCERALGRGDLVLMRCDPPVDADYIYATMLLERAEAAGATVINAPRSLRDFNEKLAILRFPDLIAPTLVASDPETLREFVREHGKVVLKPLDGMGGRGIFMATDNDPNLSVILETLTGEGRHPAMAQRFLPGIRDGDKRVLIVGGEVVPYMLARIPGERDFRGNLARGGRGVGLPIGTAERRVAEAVAPELLANGILFAGIDIIDGHLTEVNVTSPTCVRELDREFGLNIAALLYDRLP
ncbi:MAG: glutathione synthase [Wenzhouxiangellaceae bacterium]